MRKQFYAAVLIAAIAGVVVGVAFESVYAGAGGAIAGFAFARLLYLFDRKVDKLNK